MLVRKMFKKSTSYFFSFLGLCFLILALATPQALAQEIYLSPSYTGKPIWSDSPFHIDFEPNEKICVQKYGKKWQSECSAILGEVGSPPKGLVATGWPEGDWRWTSSDRLTFYPNSSWSSSTTYTVNLTNLEIPSYVHLDKETINFTSIPRSVQINDAKVWIDPTPKAEHAISLSMTFTESLSKEIRDLLVEESKMVYPENGIEISNGKWIWLENNTRAIVNLKILNLPKEKSTLSASIGAGVRPLWYEEGYWHFPNTEATQEIIVQGTDSLLSLKEVKLEKWENKALGMENHLVFNFTQQISPEELLKNLTVLELPLHRSEENIKASDWSKGGIDNKIKQSARKIIPQIVQIPGENAEYIRFRLDTSPTHYIYWNISKDFGQLNDKGIKTSMGKSLDGVEYISKGEPRLEFLQAGNILMDGSDLTLLSEKVDKIKWHAHRFKENSLGLPFLNNMDDRIYGSQLDAETTVHSGEIVLKQLDDGKAEYSSNPIFTTLASKEIFTNNQGKMTPGLIYLRLSGYKGDEVVASTSRMLIYTNMGLVLKKLPSSRLEAYVCSIDQAEALENVSVQVLGRNGLPIAEVKTDQSGKTILPDLSSFSAEKAPSALLLRKKSWIGGGEDILWMPLNDYSRYVNTSQFMDIQGKQSGKNSLNAFVFAERGLFRPGETLNFGTLLRANDWSLIPETMPLVATIFDSSNRKIYQENFKAGQNIHSFSWKIPQNVPTGDYRLSISTPGNRPNEIGIVLGSHEVQVEMFVPDTLRITTDLVQAEKTDVVKSIPIGGWLITSDKAGNTALKVELKTLFGQVAPNRRITSEMRFYPAQLKFSGYEDYIFQDTNPFFSGGYDPITRPLIPTTTNKQGEAILPLDFSQWRFGTLQCFISTQGFEPDGGRSVMAEKRFLLSPMPYMLGYKAGEYADNMHFITKNNPAKLEFMAITSTLKPANAGKLSFSLARRQPITSLVTDSLGRYSFAETIVDQEISKEEHVITDDGKLSYNLPTNQVGEFLLTVKEAKENGLVLAKIPYSIVGNDDLRPALYDIDRLPMAKLHIKTNKTAYQGGETAKLMVSAPYAGVALLTLERDTVAEHKWVKIPMGNSMHELKIPATFTGRGYIQVLMGRDPKSEEIFLQPQSIAIASISVNTDSRSVPLQISAPEKVQPGKSLTFNIKNTANKPTKAIVYAVDEGILQLSVYSTPKPLHYLLLDRALEVSTAQLFDRIMPTSEKIMKRLSAFGGGMAKMNAFDALLGNFQNPFKRNQEAPMTWWSKVVEIPAQGLDMEIPIPSHYNGNIRIMAVAQTEQEVGSISKNVLVASELVLSPQMPSMVALGDHFDGALAITNTTDKDWDLSINLALEPANSEQNQTDDLITHGLPKEVKLKAKEEIVLPFQVSVGDIPGSATLKFTATEKDGKSFVRNSYISVRPATLPLYTQKTLSLNQSMAINLDRKMLPYNAKTELTISPIPLPLLSASLNYLQNYPYDCVEQTISKSFALVALKNTSLYKEVVNNTSSITEKSLEENLDKTHNALMASYTPYGGISLWTDRNVTDLFLTAYAADYLLGLEEANLPTPPSLMPQLFNTLERMLYRTPDSKESLRAYAYALWVLARAGYVVSDNLEVCESYIKRNKDIKSDIANTLMAGAYKAIFMDAEAQKNLDKVLGNAPETWRNTSEMFDLLAQHGLHARVLAKHFPHEFREAIPLLQSSFVEGLNKSHATLGASMAAVGLMEILKVYSEQEKNMDDVQVLCSNYNQVAKEQDSFAESFSNLLIFNAPNCSRFEIKLAKKQNLFTQIQEYGYNEKMPTKASIKGISLIRTLTNITKDIPFNGTITQGELLRVDIDIALMENNELPLVMVDLLPGGFELVLNHEDDTDPSWNLSLYREEDRVIAYIDASSSKVRRITYHIRAIAKGDFALPAVQAEGLFDRNLQSHSTSGRIKVIAP